MNIVNRKPILKGWSADKKYCITDENGKRFLLRVSDIAQYDAKQAEFVMMQRVASLGVPMCLPVEFGTCDEGVYSIQSWIDGESAEDLIPLLSSEKQYDYGLEAGRILRRIHSIQTVMVAQMPEDQLSGKSLGYKTVITVTAQTGKTRIYTIHYPVELSTEATLNMIMLGGKTLPNFDAERFNYKVDIEKEASIPVVSVIKKEDVQTNEIQVLEDVVHIKVTAEDVNFSHTYTLTFERQKSNVTTLRDIVLTDAKGVVFPSYEFPYRPEVYSYTVNLKYDGNKSLDSQLPKITPVFYDPEQKADTMKFNLPNGDIQVDITVTAANGEDQAVYSIVFHFVKSSDATLQSLLLNGVELEGFDPSQMEYTYAHPYGTKPEAYFGQDAVTYVLNDQTATVAVSTDENGVIHVVVTAQDGITTLTYLISQMTAVDG
ncbi:MAG: phosphotransferase, partial [Firmicutes bacterium]|nr:phosphotransferase [Bacillota bacterium]